MFNSNADLPATGSLTRRDSGGLEQPEMAQVRLNLGLKHGPDFSRSNELKIDGQTSNDAGHAQS